METVASENIPQANADVFQRVLGITAQAACTSEWGSKYKPFFDKYSLDALYGRLIRESKIAGPLGTLEKPAITELLGMAQAPPTLPRSPGTYLAILTDKNRQGWHRLYVGQTINNLHRRIGHHVARMGHGDQKLFYNVWRGDEVDCHWVVLSESQPEKDGVDKQAKEDNETWLSVVEFFYSLLLETLQSDSMRKYLGDAWVGPSQGLNVSIPLKQISQRPGGWMKKPENPDDESPEFREYREAATRRFLAQGQEAQVKTHWVGNSRGQHARRGENAPTRTAGEGDPTTVMIRCNKCKDDASIVPNANPLFCKVNGTYVINQKVCRHCRKRSYHFPISKELKASIHTAADRAREVRRMAAKKASRQAEALAGKSENKKT
jgi:hypothetical protein